ncbi:MAG: orotate phosphoribosyltransferase [Pseudomonadota bacterium]|nr:orotate phosphoribosyltransferase [Pseudomonadota bacterium]MEC7830186.1 orotate phosphoribosyltransferase [Pseudomonadota bacterium]MEC9382703.1 orotate phosphoribosyltransferase [Pseudomonadota bacterium]MEC9414487.1 orotate phosphoribosyltransferase [Pseudomonadota bacterium]|tara:strand:- start:1413 stop:1994 length:582 start_codon:yes stop_codon:yes gene_type:complete
MEEKEVIEEFKRCGALLEGHFVLSSGLHSTKYLQCALALSKPKLAKKLTLALGEKIKNRFNEHIDFVIAPAMGGLIVGHEIAMFLDLPFLFLERVDGKFDLRRGFSVKSGSNCLMIEDVVTTGLSSKEAINVVKRLGGNVIGEACIIDRSGGNVDLGIELLSLVTLNIPTYKSNEIPDDLKSIPAEKPGSRNL